jgi:hypothetical protein
MRLLPPVLPLSSLLLLLSLPVAAALGEPVCAGCPMAQDSHEYAGLGAKTFEALKGANGDVLKGNFLSVSDVKTQVVAGTFFTMKVHSTLDEVCSVKLFQALPDENRIVKYEVSFASLESSPVHGEGAGDLVIAPQSAGEVRQKAVPLETRGATWTLDASDQGVY